MKSIGATLQRTYLQKTAERNIVRHPAKLFNILGWVKLCSNYNHYTTTSHRILYAPLIVYK